MGLSFNELAPLLRQARDRYRSNALEAFAGIEPKICGRVQVVPFTLRMFVELDGAGNRFLTGSDAPQIEDALMFLWRVSPIYSRTDEETRNDFIRTVPLAIYPYGEAELVSQIIEYIRRTLSGAPLTKKSRGSDSVGTWISSIVHIFAKEYGWTEDYILDLPLRRIWQYLNRILEDGNPKYKELCDEEQSLRAQWLREQNAN